MAIDLPSSARDDSAEAPKLFRDLDAVFRTQGKYMDTHSVDSMYPRYVDLFRNRYAALLGGPSDVDRDVHIKGLLTEFISTTNINRLIRKNRLPLKSVNSRELRDSIDRQKFRNGILPSQVIFADGKHYHDQRMEVDFLCKSEWPYSFDYVGFDFTLTKKSKENDRRRSRRVSYVSNEILKQPMLLVDIQMEAKKYEFHIIEENLYRMKIPTRIDLDKAMETLRRKIGD